MSLFATALASVAGILPAGGALVVGQERAGPRAVDLEIRSPSVPGSTGVRVLLPRGYRSSSERYPVLYLLHGAGDDFRAWTDKGDAERLTRGRRLIVVMPDTGPTGGYVNWRRGPAWETYHLDELVPLVDGRFRTVAARRGRAVAGLSMGGFGALHYAARRPGLFAAAASFSGVVDITNPLVRTIYGPQVLGPWPAAARNYRRHNPLDLARRLRTTDVTLRTGDGRPFGDVVESVVHATNVRLHRRLLKLGIRHTWEDRGPARHVWSSWRRDLRRTLPGLMRTLER